MDQNPDFEKLSAQFAELKQHGYELQAKGVNLVRIAESGASNVAAYSLIFSASVPFANKDESLQQKLKLMAESGQFTSKTLAKANNDLSNMSVNLDAMTVQTLSGVTFTNVAVRDVASRAVEFVAKEQRQIFTDFFEKPLSVPFNTAELDALLFQFGEDLPKRRAGAWDAFHSVSSDALAQASHTMRDILAKVIAKKADNAAIEGCEWYIERKAKDVKAKPNISDRIRYLLYGPSAQVVDEGALGMAARSVSEYVDDDGALKSVAHGSQSFTREQIKLSLEKIEELLYLVLKRIEDRKSV